MEIQVIRHLYNHRSVSKRTFVIELARHLTLSPKRPVRYDELNKEYERLLRSGLLIKLCRPKSEVFRDSFQIERINKNMRTKYNYHHFVNNKEVTKSEFLTSLQDYFIVCHNYGDGSNPLLNIGVVDDEALMRKYNALKRTGDTQIYCGSNSSTFHIVRELTDNKGGAL